MLFSEVSLGKRGPSTDSHPSLVTMSGSATLDSGDIPIGLQQFFSNILAAVQYLLILYHGIHAALYLPIHLSRQVTKLVTTCFAILPYVVFEVLVVDTMTAQLLSRLDGVLIPSELSTESVVCQHQRHHLV